jgi:hypothetical protein
MNSYLIPPRGVDWDEKNKTKGIYRIAGPGHKGWSRNVDHELGNYDFLLGIDVCLCDRSFCLNFTTFEAD